MRPHRNCARSVASSVAYALAEEIVALAVDDTYRAAKQAGDFRNDVNDAVAQAIKSVTASWSAAGKTAAHHLLLVAANNPLDANGNGKTAAQLLRRPDMQQAMTEPFVDAAQKTSEAVRAAVEQGWRIGGQQAAQALAGLGTHGYDLLLEDDEVMQSVLADVQKNMDSTRQRLSQAFAQEDKQAALAKATADLERRAKYSVEYALRRSAEERRAKEYAMAGMGLMWVSRLAANTCSYCLALHGQVIPPGGTFESDTKLGIYHDLKCPPRHPNCQCVVVPVLTGKPVSVKQSVKRTTAKPETPTPITPERVVAAEVSSLQAALRRPTPPPPPTVISSKALKKVPRGLLNRLIAWLTKWFDD